jgi:hypothetical protein
MNSGSDMWNAFRLVIGMWTAGTILIRLVGHRILQTGQAGGTVVLYLLSFLAMALLIPRVFRRLNLERDSWFKAATLLILPTLVLDPFSCVYFSSVFPNVDPAAAGAFGGWMLICCGGAIAGVWAKA